MDEAYAVFDTFSVGENLDNTPGAPTPKLAKSPAEPDHTPVVARIPRVDQRQAAAPATQPEPVASENVAQPKRMRLDIRGSESQPHSRAVGEVASSGVQASITVPATQQAPDTAADNAVQLRVDAAPTTATQQHDPGAVPAEDLYAQDPLAETLLRLDAIVAPYARWIAMLAVIAAIGLTLVLLRGESVAPAGDAPGPSINQTNSGGELGVFADLGPLDPITPSAAGPAIEATSTPLAVTAATASGPTSVPIVAASQRTTAPLARLTGEIRSVEPVVASEPPSATTPNIATRPQSYGYPRTAGYPATEGSTRR